MRYVAQENLERLPLAHRRIKHPRISSALFRGFDSLTGRFVPSDDLSFQYPGSLSTLEPSSQLPGEISHAATQTVLSVRRACAALNAFVNATAAREEGATADADAPDDAGLVMLTRDENAS